MDDDRSGGARVTSAPPGVAVVARPPKGETVTHPPRVRWIRPIDNGVRCRFPLGISIGMALCIVLGAAQAPPSTASSPSIPIKTQLPPLQLTSGPMLAPYQPAEFWGGGNLVESCMTCSINQVAQVPGGQSIQPGQDVDPTTGNFSFSHSLFSVPAVGGDLGVGVNYNSQSAQVQFNGFLVGANGPGPTGFGWTLSGLPTLTAGAGGQETMNENNGAQVTFTPAASEASCPSTLDASEHTVYGSTQWYCAPGRVDAQLGKTSSGTFEFQVEGGRQTTLFDIYGNATSEGNAQSGTDIHFTTSVTPGTGACPNKTGAVSCTLITDSAGRNTAIVYGPISIGGVQDPLGRYYTFGYTLLNSHYQLTSIADPLSDTWTLGYAGGSSSSIYQYDMTSITNPDTATSAVAYNSTGMVQSTTDGFGSAHTTQYAYTNVTCTPTNCAGTLPPTQHTEVTYPDGEVDVDNYYAGLLTSDSFGAGAIPGSAYFDSASYNYNLPTMAEGDVIESVVAPGARNHALTTVVTTDAQGDVLSVRDPNGNVTTNLYNTAVANVLFDEPCWSASPGVNIAGATCASPPSGATVYTFDSYGDMTSVTDPLGNVSGYIYNANGFLCLYVPPTSAAAYVCGVPTLGDTQYTPDAYGNLAQEAVPARLTSQMISTATYDADDEMLTSVPGNGNVTGVNPVRYQTSYSYDGVGRLQTMTAPMGRSTSYTYDPVGNVLTETDPAGVSTATYDADSRTCWSFRGSSAVPTPTCATVPTGSTSYQYLADTSAPTTVTDQNGKTTTYSYANPEFPTSPTETLDAAGTAPTYNAYDANGRVCLSGPVNLYPGPPTCAVVAQDTYKTYDAYGNVVSSTDPNGNTTNYTYGDVAFPSLVTASTDALGHTTRYTYDADGNQTVLQDPSGDVVTTGYDKDGRVCWQAPSALFLPLLSSGQCAQPSGTGVTLFNYYLTSQRSQMIDNAGTPSQAVTSYSYDASGNLTSTTDDNAKTVSYQYDTANDVTCIAYPVVGGSTCNNVPSASNTVVDRVPDVAGRLQSTTDWLGNTTSYQYDASNNVTKVTYPPSTSESVTYSYANELTLSSAVYAGTVVGSASESWIPNADELVSQDTVPSALSATGTGYTSNPGYDLLNRVSSATNPLTTSGADTYGYAPNGELTTDLPPGTGKSNITYSYNAGDELTSKVDPNLSVTSTYAFTPDGQRCWSIASNISGPSCASPPTGATSYAWNAFGELCWSGSTTSTNPCSSPPSGVTTYGYNGDGLRMTSTTGGTTQQYTWDSVDAANAPLLLEDGTNAYISGPTLFGGTAPIEQISLTSHQASYLSSTPSGVQLAFSQAGSLVNKSAYSTYGLQTNSGSSATSFGFEGGYTDPSGLIYLDHRYYDPSTGQFISVDPAVGMTGQPYSYAGDDPLNASDPSGLLIRGPNGQTCGPTTAACVAQGQQRAAEAQQSSELPLAPAAAGVVSAGTVGSPNKWVFAQKKYSPRFSDSDETLPAVRNKPVSQVVSELNSGELNPDQIPIDLYTTHGRTYILNTRSANALQRANIPREEWTTRDVTGDSAALSRLKDQLSGSNLQFGEGVQDAVESSGTSAPSLGQALEDDFWSAVDGDAE